MGKTLVVIPDHRERARAAVHLRALGLSPVLASSPLEGIDRLLHSRVTSVVVSNDLFTTTGRAFLDFVANEFPQVVERFVWDEDDRRLDDGSAWHAA